MDGVTQTFAEHDGRVNRLVAGLAAHGIWPADRMAVMARNCLEYLEVYGAAEKGGFVVAPVNFRLTAEEVAALLEYLGPRVIFAQSHYVPLLDSIRDRVGSVDVRVCLDGDAGDGWLPLEALRVGLPDVDPPHRPAEDDVCYLMLTSGTTGLPRAAELTHRGQWLDAAAIALQLALTPQDRHLAMMPLYHVGGRALPLAHMLLGCTVHLQDSFDAHRFLDAVECERITTTQVVPTMVAWLLESCDLAGRDLSSLRRIWYASAPMPAELMRRALAQFGAIFIQGYGQTEAGPLVTAMQPAEHAVDGPWARRLASCGRAVPGVELRLAADEDGEVPAGAVGEIVVRSPFLMTGYWRKPDLTSEVLRDGWLHTGDMASMDEEGYVYIVDRRKDVIITGGENVYPREVEEVLYAHPAVVEAAVVGIPDEVWGEAVKALVVLREGVAAAEEELIRFCKDRLAGYKCPRSVEVRDALPKSPSGKVLKRELREPFWGGRERRV